MNDVKKTWCGPVYTLDPEKMERQFNRLSAEGWQLEGTGWLSFRYRRGAPNEYRYRVQYLYESRDGQRDDYVCGSRGNDYNKLSVRYKCSAFCIKERTPRPCTLCSMLPLPCSRDC